MSFKESKADDLIHTENLDLIELTKQHLVRVYPGTRRQNSSNIHPISYWNHGINIFLDFPFHSFFLLCSGVQMVALNYQARDESMCLQYGLFSDNGGCGYLLKPAFLLAKDRLFDPKEKVYGKVKRVQIQIISAQHLPKEHNSIEDSDIVDPYVKVWTYGIQSDCTEHRTPSIRNNGLNPIWDHKINIDIHCPELCLILFQVRDEDRFSRSTFLGQVCIPFTAVQLGYRHIKLRAKNGDYIHGTLFVHIKIEDF
jgi:phosphatidylinositol phospholipase C delta